MDSPTETQSANNPHGLNQRELEIAAALWLSAKDGEPQIDWDKFMINHPTYKDKKSAQATIRLARNKFLAIINGTANTGSDAAAPTAAPAPKKKATPAKRKKATVEDDGDAAAEAGPAKKIQAKRGRKTLARAPVAPASAPADAEPKDSNDNQVADVDLLGDDGPGGDSVAGLVVAAGSVLMGGLADPWDGEI